MAGAEDIQRCSVTHCDRPAASSDSGAVGRWIVVIPYCSEHARELSEGTPLGGVGLDSSRVFITAAEDAMPGPGGRFPGID